MVEKLIADFEKHIKLTIKTLREKADLLEQELLESKSTNTRL